MGRPAEAGVGGVSAFRLAQMSLAQWIAWYAPLPEGELAARNRVADGRRTTGLVYRTAKSLMRWNAQQRRKWQTNPWVWGYEIG